MKINNTVLFDPAISSLNIGDHIISESAKKQIRPIIENDFIVEVSTHLPISRMYMRHLKNSEQKFVLGSNLLRGKMDRIFRQWDIRIDQSDLVKNSILVGVGWWQYGDEPNYYTKQLYKNILSHDYLHSVRDEFTKQQLSKIGITNVLNTSCSTMWDLTEEHCSDISTEKQNKVVFTLTDYNKDIERDSKLINQLLENYQEVYYWVQGTGDYLYLESLPVDISKIKIIPPSLEAFDKVLMMDGIEYVGTRLHGGIRALQHKRRTLIIGIDNRATEKKKDFNLNVIDRKNIDQLDEIINRRNETNIVIPIKEIEEWKNQFKK